MILPTLAMLGTSTPITLLVGRDGLSVFVRRNYVTFDVIRRILEDYFHYDVFAVMNITDVDDKIILRARKNHLLKQYEQLHPTLTIDVLEDIAEGYKDYKQDVIQKKQELSVEIEQLKAKKKKNKTEEKEAEQKLLQEKLNRAEASEKALSQLRLQVEKGEQVQADKAYELATVRDALADLIDKRQGHTVSDERIFRAHAAHYEEEFLSDMKKLGVRMPDAMTRVTEYIPEIISYVKQIEEKGLAYVTNGSVYFDTVAFTQRGAAYGKLEPWAVGDGKLLISGEGSLTGKDCKRSENDFALWKNSKPGEPSWPSPWGQGRPGWHIECSAMASDLFGDNMDIHSGGSDLRFPHHDNELAQAEAHFGCSQWVNYFLHSGTPYYRHVSYYGLNG